MTDAYQRGVRAERARIVAELRAHVARKRSSAAELGPTSEHYDALIHGAEVLEWQADALNAEPAGGKGESDATS